MTFLNHKTLQLYIPMSPFHSKNPKIEFLAFRFQRENRTQKFTNHQFPQFQPVNTDTSKKDL